MERLILISPQGYNAGGDFESTCLDGNELGDYNSFILVPPKGGKSPCKLK